MNTIVVVVFYILDMAELLHEGLRDAISTTLVTPQAICMKETVNLLLACSGGYQLPTLLNNL